MNSEPPSSAPSPVPGPEGLFPSRFLATLTAYRSTAALKASLELNIFTSIGKDELAASEIAARCGASERGVRILCDWLTVFGFLSKAEQRYRLTPESAAFLDRASPSYIAESAAAFVLAPSTLANYERLTEAVREGGAPGEAVLVPDNPLWTHFALGMAPTRWAQAEALVDMLSPPEGAPVRVLDVSASHGAYGLAVAKRCAEARITALDWPSVLDVLRREAERADLAGRIELLPGDAFTLDWGSGFDIVVIANFLHHFGRSRCLELLRKAAAALDRGGRIAIVEFVPDEDGIAPPEAAIFSLGMLAGTAEGQAYSFSELRSMLTDAGFANIRRRTLPPGLQVAVVAELGPREHD